MINKAILQAVISVLSHSYIQIIDQKLNFEIFLSIVLY